MWIYYKRNLISWCCWKNVIYKRAKNGLYIGPILFIASKQQRPVSSKACWSQTQMSPDPTILNIASEDRCLATCLLCIPLETEPNRWQPQIKPSPIKKKEKKEREKETQLLLRALLIQRFSTGQLSDITSTGGSALPPPSLTATAFPLLPSGWGSQCCVL